MKYGKLLVVLLVTLTLAIIVAAAGKEPIKEPAVAGAFYPGGTSELRQAVDRYLAAATAPPVNGRLLGLIAPHAGYEFSGPVAA